MVKRKGFSSGGIVPNSTVNRRINKVKMTLVPNRSGKPTKGDYEQLADLKTKLKALEEKAKVLQKQIIEDGGEKEVETSFGTLKFQTRENWDVTDKNKVFTTMGSACFLENCTISKSGIIKGIGEKGFKQLTDAKIIKSKPDTTYYVLKKKKK